MMPTHHIDTVNAYKASHGQGNPSSWMNIMQPMHYWLVKSEPGSFSWTQQMERGIEPWTGVRSHEAKRNLMAMRKGDLAFFYHSTIGKEIVGVVEVVREAYPDPSVEPGTKAGAKAGEWVCVDMRAVGPFARPVTLTELKGNPDFTEMGLIRKARLSVVPVSAEHWNRISRLGGWTMV